jgi:hypothetical protein
MLNLRTALEVYKAIGKKDYDALTKDQRQVYINAGRDKVSFKPGPPPRRGQAAPRPSGPSIGGVRASNQTTQAQAGPSTDATAASASGKKPTASSTKKPTGPAKKPASPTKKPAGPTRKPIDRRLVNVQAQGKPPAKGPEAGEGAQNPGASGSSQQEALKERPKYGGKSVYGVLLPEVIRRVLLQLTTAKEQLNDTADQLNDVADQLNAAQTLPTHGGESPEEVERIGREERERQGIASPEEGERTWVERSEEEAKKKSDKEEGGEEERRAEEGGENDGIEEGSKDNGSEPSSEEE